MLLTVKIIYCPTSGFFSGVANSFVSNIHRLKCEEKFVSLVKKKIFGKNPWNFGSFFLLFSELRLLLEFQNIE